MRERVIVLKLGGSVLRGEESLARAVHEIFRWRRAGRAVAAVVSAFRGETDRLLARARRLGGRPETLAAAAAQGEHLAAALLAAALDKAGVPCRVLAPAALGLEADGPPLAARPRRVDAGRLARALLADGVAVVPGFAGVDRDGRTVLFGRGGSDLTAVFLAAALGARCRLIKDTGGLYERDPADRDGPPPRRYARARYADALATDGTVVQHEAVRLAARRGLAFEVAAPLAGHATAVGARRTRLAEAGPSAGAPAGPPPLRVALLGLGTVGGGVARLVLGMPRELELAVACSRRPGAARALGVPACTDPVAAARGGAEVVVELLGGLEPARSAVRAALEAGLDVVTANKRLMAEHGVELERLARARGARILASAAVGGAAPVLERLRAAGRRAADVPVEVRGVLNGTANHVLERLARGATLARALDEARALGLAERDAERDLDGRDTADKLVLCARALGLDVRPARGGRIGPRTRDAARAARARGRALRQVARLVAPRTGEGARAEVRLEEVAPDDPLFALEGAANAAVIRRADGRVETVRGTGAGRWPTAESVLGDLLALARRRRARARATVA